MHHVTQHRVLDTPEEGEGREGMRGEKEGLGREGGGGVEREEGREANNFL